MQPPSPRVVIVMGVSGSGKSTVGLLLANLLNAAFVDADDLHPPENKAKMAAKIPLTDADRLPWLQHLRSHVIDSTPKGHTTVLACSALKASYRHLLTSNTGPDVRIVFLQGSKDLIAARLAARSGHFMPPDLLTSQFATLEPPSPAEAIIIPINAAPHSLASNAHLALLSPSSSPPAHESSDLPPPGNVGFVSDSTPESTKSEKIL